MISDLFGQRPVIRSARLLGYQLILDCDQLLSSSAPPATNDFTILMGVHEIGIQCAFLACGPDGYAKGVVLILDRIIETTSALSISYVPTGWPLEVICKGARMEAFLKTFALTNEGLNKPPVTLENVEPAASIPAQQQPEYRRCQVSGSALSGDLLLFDLDQPLDASSQPSLNDFKLYMDARVCPVEAISIVANEPGHCRLALQLPEPLQPNGELWLRYLALEKSLLGEGEVPLAEFELAMKNRQTLSEPGSPAVTPEPDAAPVSATTSATTFTTTPAPTPEESSRAPGVTGSFIFDVKPAERIPFADRHAANDNSCSVIALQGSSPHGQTRLSHATVVAAEIDYHYDRALRRLRMRQRIIRAGQRSLSLLALLTFFTAARQLTS